MLPTTINSGTPSPLTSATTGALMLKSARLSMPQLAKPRRSTAFIHVDPHLAPDLGPHRADAVEDGVRRELVAVAVDSSDVVRTGGTEDLLEAVAFHVGHDDVLVEEAFAIARVAAVSRRPAQTH